MGIFKNITKTLKQAAPFIGSAIGMYLGGPAGAALGSGIGSLAAGRDAEEALKAAALAGGTAYLSGYGKGFQKMPSDAAKIKISDIKLIKANTKTVAEESTNSDVEQQ